MDSNEIKKGIIRAVAYIIGIALLLLFIYKIQSVILYIIIAAIISLIGLPIVKFLKTKLKFNNTLAVIIAMTTIIGLLSSLIGLLIPLVVEQGQNLSLLNIKELESSVESLYQKVIHYLSDKDIDVDKSLTTSNLFSKIDYSIIPNFLNAIIGGFGSFSIALFSIIFISFFLLIDSKLLEQGILTFVQIVMKTVLKDL